MCGPDLVAACPERALSQIAVHLAGVADLVVGVSAGAVDLARLAVAVPQSVLESVVPVAGMLVAPHLTHAV